MAAYVFYRRPARAACAIRSFQCEGVGSLAQDSSAQLEQPGTRNHQPLEIISLSHGIDDDDELFLTWNAGYVPHFPQALLEQDAGPSRRDQCDLRRGRNIRRHSNRFSLRPLRTPPG